jgi:uncharacterized Rossmann fold enzyme
MDFITWEPFYKKIIADFNFSEKEDKRAAALLNKLLQKKPTSMDKLENLIGGKEVYVFGAAPSLESTIHKHKNRFEESVIITADGSTSALMKHNIVPNVIVTDLDGNIADQQQANSKGSLVVIHAHGDNIEQIKKEVSNFKGDIIGTTQTDPRFYDNLYNFGGFTDGDRATFLANRFNAKNIWLLGFDFADEIGSYSFAEHKNKEVKLKKLQWCKQLLDTLQKDNPNIYYL